MADVEEREDEKQRWGEGKRGHQMLAEIQAKSKRMFDWVIWKLSSVFSSKQNAKFNLGI